MTDEDFARIVGEALDELPRKYTDSMNNVAIVYQDDPTPEQRVQLKLRGGQTLFGLYQGVPLPGRAGYNLALPDKITIFKNPLLRATGGDMLALKAQVKHTLWHEIAHHFGLDHDRIHDLERG